MSYIKYGLFNFIADSGYPVPQISISVDQDRDGGGRIIGSKTVVTLEGVIYSASGSRGFESLTSKENGLREAFKSDGQMLQIGCTGTGGSNLPPYFSGYPKVNRYSAEKTDNYWVNTINYSIELQIESSGNGSGIFAVTSTQDEWNIEILDDTSFVNNPVGGSVLRQALSIPDGTGFPTYRVSRTLGAVGKYIPTGGNGGLSAVDNAKKWVLYQASSGLTLSGIINGLQLYNFTRSISVSDVDGSYRLTDNWIAVPSGALSGNYVESYTVESSLDNSYLRSVVINGTIKGLEPFNTGAIYQNNTIGSGISGSIYPTVAGPVRVTNTSKFDKAVSGYSGVKSLIYNRAQSFIEKQNNTSGIFRRFFGRDEAMLNPLPLSITEGYNPTEGSVTYSWTFNNRPLNLVSGSISEVLTVNDNFPTQQVAEIFVLGRRLGPILQDLGTYTTASRDVNFEVVMLRPTGLNGLRFPKTAYTAITGIVETFNPAYLFGAGGQCKSFVKNNTENWSVSEGRFVKTKGWSWTKCDDIPGTNPNVG
jgi:hypothetical protein